MMMNGYNDYPINRQAWAAVIQPKTKITMSMILHSSVVKKGRCADPSCSGRVSFTTAKHLEFGELSCCFLVFHGN
jgi:hypothetical protein